ncbi:GTP 3',8-cyclase MoaA [Eikenella sp. S3360]|uniref:GTP 3',8-cyclase MoaA n=1 Tax=Eikenella glucosivorans TaxID=2766967 RepID=A0ABS0N858_9NEIS|nr:GTP 3',8-cyclase MoaA [Eikenella glucosivorans]MBH5328489.1 GTP 3',8-cyclase MoaA [Eikenella glucosivorans]
MTAQPPLTDPYQRRLSYLRLSVTDLCNYRCTYCLPDGYQGKAKPDELTLPEIQTLVNVFAAAGTRKIRLTGGEPTLRRDLADIIAACKANPLIENVALTTNAFRLAKLFPAYRAAGLDKINISIDSFDPDTFFQITGKRECANILRALDGILDAGFYGVKVNTLLLRRYAERTLADALAFVRARPVTLRFIELMQTGDNGAFFNSQHLSAAEIERGLQEQGWQLAPRLPHAGPAREYFHRDFAGSIGFIAPYSEDFCKSCNRLRVTAQGKMHLCLFGGIAYDLRPFLRAGNAEGLRQYLHQTIAEKPEHHYLHDKKVGLITNLSMTGG